MTRAILQAAIPILLPFVLYFAYAYLVRKRRPGDAEPIPWSWLIGAGLLLAIVVSIILLFLGGADPGQTYIPPRYEDGRIVPGHFE